MNGTTTERQVLEIDVASQEPVSLDDVLAAGSDEPRDGSPRSHSEQGPMLPRIPASAGVVVGTLVGVDETGRPLVVFGRGNRAPTAARSTVPLAGKDIGRDVVMTFEGGDAAKPIVLGMFATVPAAGVQTTSDGPSLQEIPAMELTLDGERIVLNAEREIVLRCGEASITLTRAGKVLIRGAYLLSRSSGVNRIKGGSVQIN